MTKHQSFHYEFISLLSQESSKEGFRIGIYEAVHPNILQPIRSHKSLLFPRLSHIYKLQE